MWAASATMRCGWTATEAAPPMTGRTRVHMLAVIETIERMRVYVTANEWGPRALAAEWPYEETSTLPMNGFPERFAYPHRNTLRRVG